MLMELAGKLLFLNKYGELETVKPRDQAEASVGAAVGASGGVDCVMCFHIIHLYWIKWLGVLYFPLW